MSDTDTHEVPPTLIIVSGPTASGKTTLAHKIAQQISCPVISRDELKEGMVYAITDFTPDWGDPLTRRATETFFDVIGLLLERGVTHVAEAAFQDGVWRHNLSQVRLTANLRVVHCQTGPEIAHRRAVDRGSRRAHVDGPLLQGLAHSRDAYESFQRYNSDAPSLTVNTTAGYDPSLDQIADFITRPHAEDQR